MKIRNAVLFSLIVLSAFIGIQVRAADSNAPSITNSPLTVATTLGATFGYSLTATNSPTSYFASALPIGLMIDSTTGIISGSPTLAGTTSVVVGARNAAGAGIATLTITVATSDVPVVSNAPLFAPGTVNTRFGYVLTSSGSAIYAAGTLPNGLTLQSVNGVITGTPTSAGTTLVPITVSDINGTSTVALTIAIGAADAPVPEYVPAPEIKSVSTAAARVGTPFTYLLVATNSPSNYSATGLPAGLSLNTITGAITGTPTTAGTYAVVLTATNATATAAISLTITVAPPPVVAPVITGGPFTASATVGTAFPTFQIAATGSPTSYTASGLPAGLSLNTSSGAITGTPTTAGTFVVSLTAVNSAGTSAAPLTITVAPAPVAPTITSATSATARVGDPFPTYVITASGLPTGFFAVGLPAGLSLNLSTGAITGTPSAAGTAVVTIGASNSTGTGTATLTIVVAAAPSSRIVNFSARALSGPGEQTLVMGFVVAGNGKNLLVRGIGPALVPFGVLNVVADPMLTVMSGSTSVASNDDWQATVPGQATADVIAATALRVGGFALPAASRDSALITVLNTGAYTTSMARPNSTTGVALTEIYDLDLTGTSRFVNVSTRINVSAGEGTLIAGLAISGNAPKTVLVRGVGPALSQFGVTGVLADPQIAVFSGATVIATNDNWETGGNAAGQIAATSAQVGAFALTAGSRDAALLVTLQPGSYTVQVTGVGNATGVALVEIYDTQ